MPDQKRGFGFAPDPRLKVPLDPVLDYLDEETLRQLAEMSRSDTKLVQDLTKPLCDRFGYGFVMQAISEMWRQRDPFGALTVGPAYGTIEADRKLASVIPGDGGEFDD
jgi:hypothetical protein